MGLSRDAALVLVGLILGILIATMASPDPLNAATASLFRDAQDGHKMDKIDSATLVTSAHINPIFAIMRMELDQLFIALLEGLQENRTGLVVEVGSFDGIQAKYAIEQGYPVVIVEPSPSNVVKVRQTLAQIPSDTYELHEKAASSVRGKVTFYSGKDSGDFVSFDGTIPEGERDIFSEKDKTTVEAMPLDDIIGDDRRIYLLKVDTQGHDLDVLHGAAKLFREKRVSIAIFEYHPARLPAPQSQLLRELDALGYDVMSTVLHPQRTARGHAQYISGDQSAEGFAESIGLDTPLKIPNRTLNGFGEWTDIVAVCRTCVGSNMFGGALRQPRQG